MKSSESERFECVALPGAEGGFDVAIAGGRVQKITPARSRNPVRLLLPAFVDLHMHADRAYAQGPRRARSLEDAVKQVEAVKRAATEQDIFERACKLFGRACAHGTARLRTHVDIDPLVGWKPLRAVARARRRFRELLDVSIVAFATAHLDPSSRSGRLTMTQAVAGEADMVGTVIPFHDDPIASMNATLDLSEDLGVDADFHIDEKVDSGFFLEALADACLTRNLRGRVTASHCCALATVSPHDAARTIDKIADARITVIALPALNLYLQDRGATTPRRRGITLVREMLEAEVPVRFGSDNVGDVFYPYGDADPLETAFLAGITAHVDDEDELLGGICDGRSEVEEGMTADLVAMEASSLHDAIARRPSDRVVLRRGQTVAGRHEERSDEG
jgi:cytosine deaminase